MELLCTSMRTAREMLLLHGSWRRVGRTFTSKGQTQHGITGTDDFKLKPVKDHDKFMMKNISGITEEAKYKKPG